MTNAEMIAKNNDEIFMRETYIQASHREIKALPKELSEELRNRVGGQLQDYISEQYRLISHLRAENSLLR